MDLARETLLDIFMSLNDQDDEPDFVNRVETFVQ